MKRLLIGWCGILAIASAMATLGGVITLLGRRYEPFIFVPASCITWFMYHFLLFVHVAACLGMILVVLLQTGRGAGLQVFGGGGDSLIQTPSGSSFMKKFTTGLAATFAFTSLMMTLLQSRTGMSSVTSQVPSSAPIEAPAAAPTAAAPAVAPAKKK